MAIPENRLSTIPITADWLSPDERDRIWTEDYEAGPIAIGDPSAGQAYQSWHLTYADGTGTFTVTPETTGSPVDVRTGILNVTQCTFAFDQNGNVTLAYTESGVAKLYWYDTAQQKFVTDTITDAIFPSVCMDDKRTTQNTANDIALFYTKQQPDTTYNLYYRKQRERFLTEYELEAGVPPYVYKFGMHAGLRIQIGLLSGLTAPVAEYILKESGEYLLLESANRIIKE
jgi:hypothetical protein